jgi:hypothetical protein
MNEVQRLKRIEQLMESDPAPDTDEGRLLNALVDEQIEAEKDFAFDTEANAK